jgi:cold shock CspA family protein
MKGRPNPATGYSFIQCEEVSAFYGGKDVYLHCKICPWAEHMGLERDTQVQFQYMEKDGAPVVSRIVREDGAA